MITVLPNLTVSEQAAKYPNSVMVSKNGSSAGRENEPSDVYGYCWVPPVGRTMWSPASTASKPKASARWTNARRPGPSGNRGILMATFILKVLLCVRSFCFSLGWFSDELSIKQRYAMLIVWNGQSPDACHEPMTGAIRSISPMIMRSNRGEYW